MARTHSLKSEAERMKEENERKLAQAHMEVLNENEVFKAQALAMSKKLERENEKLKAAQLKKLETENEKLRSRSHSKKTKTHSRTDSTSSDNSSVYDELLEDDDTSGYSKTSPAKSFGSYLAPGEQEKSVEKSVEQLAVEKSVEKPVEKPVEKEMEKEKPPKIVVENVAIIDAEKTPPRKSWTTRTAPKAEKTTSPRKKTPLPTKDPKKFDNTDEQSRFEKVSSTLIRHARRFYSNPHRPSQQRKRGADIDQHVKSGTLNRGYWNTIRSCASDESINNHIKSVVEIKNFFEPVR
ncbi:hypothetical protein TL16_g00939 [Triparma laevis f. inornata]|uniref:Uncharacterized protein n=1 Tax=Triparma laevis f. inornata TaxID=1714386 RepID=A0A9W6ZGZ5_9STRA|nr:hypothetical protein TL16_g00939 [Triparma laevis f. inornata]